MWMNRLPAMWRPRASAPRSSCWQRRQTPSAGAARCTTCRCWSSHGSEYPAHGRPPVSKDSTAIDDVHPNVESMNVHDDSNRFARPCFASTRSASHVRRSWPAAWCRRLLAPRLQSQCRDSSLRSSAQHPASLIIDNPSAHARRLDGPPRALAIGVDTPRRSFAAGTPRRRDRSADDPAAATTRWRRAWARFTEMPNASHWRGSVGLAHERLSTAI